MITDLSAGAVTLVKSLWDFSSLVGGFGDFCQMSFQNFPPFFLQPLSSRVRPALELNFFLTFYIGKVFNVLVNKQRE